MNNAFKFTKAGQIDFGYILKEKWLEFFVKDTGIGIPKHLQTKIFERFRQAELELTRHYGGTGLGLSISQKLVELLGGRIWIESESGKGSSFFFTIPYIRSSLKAQPDFDKIDNKFLLNESTEPVTILLVEDEEMNIDLITESLSEYNYNFLYAVDGIEAVNLCKEKAEIDLVLMDIKMPRLNGIEALKQIKKFRPDLPVIAQTAFALEIERKSLMKEGFNDYISKPLNPELLHELIVKLTSFH